MYTASIFHNSKWLGTAMDEDFRKVYNAARLEVRLYKDEHKWTVAIIKRDGKIICVYANDRIVRVK